MPAHETKSCIQWADKTQTGGACEDHDFVTGGYAGLGHTVPDLSPKKRPPDEHALPKDP
eukprot:COSAG01_NODE_54735_length_330_cov_0.662338_1_plen_58_part_10